MKIYCLHHKPAIERKEKLLKDFEHHGLEVEWIESFPPEEIDRSQLDIRHKLNDAQLSLYLKHRTALYYQLVRSDASPTIVMEDDIILPYNWDMKGYFKRILQDFEEMDGDILNIGTAFNMHPTVIIGGKYVYHEPHFTTRCAHCYCIAQKALSKVEETINIIDDAWDWKLNHIIKNYNLKSCYVEPGLEQWSLGGGSLLQ